ncbi:hypothetical protein ABPG74_007262 [Tetrahymena malaccensis]
MQTWITDDSYLNQRLDLSQEYSLGSEIEYEVKISLLEGFYHNYELIIYASDDVMESEFEMTTSLSFPQQEDEEDYINGRIINKIQLPKTQEFKYYITSGVQNLDKIINIAEEEHPCFGQVKFYHEFQLLSVECFEQVELVLIFTEFYKEFRLKQIEKSHLLEPYFEYNFENFGFSAIFLMDQCLMKLNQQDNLELLQYNLYEIYHADNFKASVQCKQRTLILDGSHFNQQFLKKIYIQNSKDEQFYQFIQNEKEYELYYVKMCFQFFSDDFKLYKFNMEQGLNLKVQSRTPQELENEIPVQKLNFEAKKQICFPQYYNDNFVYFVFSQSQGNIFMTHIEQLDKFVYLKYDQQAFKHFIPINRGIQRVLLSQQNRQYRFQKFKICLIAENDNDDISIYFQIEGKQTYLDARNKCYFDQDLEIDLFVFNIMRKNNNSNSRIMLKANYSNKKVDAELNILQQSDIEVNEYHQLIKIRLIEGIYYQEPLLKFKQLQQCQGYLQIADKDNSLIIVGIILKNCQAQLQTSILFGNAKRNEFYIFLHQKAQFNLNLIGEVVQYQHNYMKIYYISQPFLLIKKQYFKYYSNNLYFASENLNQVASINGKSIFNQNLYKFHINIEGNEDSLIELIFCGYSVSYQEIIFYFEVTPYISNSRMLGNMEILMNEYSEFYYFWEEDEEIFNFRYQLIYSYVYFQKHEDKYLLDQMDIQEQNLKRECDGITKNNSQALRIQKNLASLQNYDYLILLIQEKVTYEFLNICPKIYFDVKSQYSQNAIFTLEVNDPTVLKFNISPYQRYQVVFSNFNQSHPPQMTYWFDNITIQKSGVIPINYDFQENQLISQENSVISTENQNYYCYLKPTIQQQDKFSIQVNFLYEFIQAQANKTNILTKQRMFIFFDQNQPQNSFIEINIRNQDLFIIPCFISLSYLDQSFDKKIAYKLFKDIYKTQNYDVLLHINSIFRFSEEQLQQQIYSSNGRDIKSEKKCLWVEQRQTDYEKGQFDSYFYYREDYNQQLEIKIGSAKFIELDIHQNITYTSIVLVKSTIHSLIRESKSLKVNNQNQIYIQNMQGSQIIIDVQEQQYFLVKHIKELSNKDILICNQNISLIITEINNQKSSSNSGYLLQFQNTTNIKLTVQYIQKKQFEYLNSNAKIIQSDQDQQMDFQIHQKSIYEVNLQVFNYPVSSYSISDLDQLFQHGSQLEAIIYISDEFYQFKKFSQFQRSSTLMNSQDFVINCKIVKFEYDIQYKTISYEIEVPNQLLLFQQNYLIRIYFKSNSTDLLFPGSQIIKIPKDLLNKKKLISENYKQKQLIQFLLILSLILATFGLFMFFSIKQLQNQAEKQI